MPANEFPEDQGVHNQLYIVYSIEDKQEDNSEI
jgi:hypothetical protein